MVVPPESSQPKEMADGDDLLEAAIHDLLLMAPSFAESETQAEGQDFQDFRRDRTQTYRQAGTTRDATTQLSGCFSCLVDGR